MGIIGRHSFELCSRPRIISSASYVGDKEGKGPLRECFDKICRDDTLGLDSWEQAESRMFESAVRVALAKIKRQSDDLSCLLGGDLLNQIISSGFAAREIRAPFIGLYGACSTISEGLMLGGMLVDGGFAELAACAASSHFSAAERQFRYPLEMGVQAVPSSQRTVTGAGSIIIQAAGEFRPGAGNVFEHVALTGGTIGSVEDFGITDANNMGAAMAPAARRTLLTHFADTCRDPDYYDLILTGDLGVLGSRILKHLMREKGVNIDKNHVDCGELIYNIDEREYQGGSGAGCSAVVFNSYVYKNMMKKKINKVLFIATGALLSTTSSQQGESIPAVAHAVAIENEV